MSITAKMDESKDLEYLNSDWKLATVYTAFLYPKSQQDAIRLIYKASKRIGDKTPDIRNPANWIIDAREKLMLRGYLVKTDNKLRNSVIKAEIEPIVQSLIAASVSGGGNSEVREGVRLVLDSAWFRNFFSDGFLNNPITYRNGTVYEPYRDIVKQNPSWSHLKITDPSLKNRLFQLLNEIGYYSHNFRWMMEDNNHRGQITYLTLSEDKAILNDLLASRNFDSMLKTHSEISPPEFVEKFYRCIEKCVNNSDNCQIDKIFPEKLIKYLLKNKQQGVQEYRPAGLFIPIPVSMLLRTCPYKSSVQHMDCGYIKKMFICFWVEEERDYPT